MQVIGTNIILLPEAVCCCLQTCNFCFDELSPWYISVPSFIVRGPTISIGTNIIYKYSLPEAVCCCLQTCNICFNQLSSWYISVPSFIVRGPTISKL